MKDTILATSKCVIQWHKVLTQCCATITTAVSRTYSSSQTEARCPSVGLLLRKATSLHPALFRGASLPQALLIPCSPPPLSPAGASSCGWPPSVCWCSPWAPRLHPVTTTCVSSVATTRNSTRWGWGEGRPTRWVIWRGRGGAVALRSREQPVEPRVWIPGDPLSCSVAESVTPGTPKGLKTQVCAGAQGSVDWWPPEAQDRGLEMTSVEPGFCCSKSGLFLSWFQCWETQVGQEMYKLMIFDLIIILAVTLFVDFPRK